MPADSVLISSVEQERMLRHLAHELRQPLSGIESIAFYLEMVYGAQAPEIQLNCERLRRMVQQAHWLLEDAALALAIPSSPLGPVALPAVLTSLGSELALHEERNLELRFETNLPELQLPEPLASRFCDHLLGFFRDVAMGQDPILVTLAREERHVRLQVAAETATEAEDLLRVLDPPAPGSAVRKFVEAAGGEMNAFLEGDLLSVSLAFPVRAEQS